MGIASALYHTVAKRTSTFVLAIGVSAFVFERGKNISKSGTSCQWNSIPLIAIMISIIFALQLLILAQTGFGRIITRENYGKI